MKAKKAIPTGRTEWAWWEQEYQRECQERGFPAGDAKLLYAKGYTPRGAAIETAHSLGKAVDSGAA